MFGTGIIWKWDTTHRARKVPVSKQLHWRCTSSESDTPNKILIFLYGSSSHRMNNWAFVWAVAFVSGLGGSFRAGRSMDPELLRLT